MKERNLLKWQVYEQMPLGVISVSLDGQIEYMNQNAQSLLNYKDQSWLGKPVDQVFRLKDISEKKPMNIPVEAIEREHDRIQIPKMTGVENYYGDLVPIKGHITPVIHEEAVEGLLYAFDLDEHAVAICDQVEVERNNFKVLFDNAPQGMMTVNRNYKIVNINAAAAEIFDFEAQDALNHSIGETFGCLNFKQSSENCTLTAECPTCVFKNSVDNVLIHGKRVNGLEFLFDFQDDFFETGRSWLKISAVPTILDDEVHALIVIEDVTLNRELAKNLIRNERRLRLITDNMIDTITQINHVGHIEFVTPSCWNLIGLSADALIGKTFTDFVYPDDLHLVQELFKKRFLTKDNFSSRLRLVRTNDEVIWVEANGSVVDDENRRRTVVYVIRDITEEVHYKQELEKSKEAAISASKSKSEFLANMSHEIRTPMNGIIGMTNITLMDRLTDEQRENMTMVKNSAVSLLAIINSILDFSKIEAGKLELEKTEFDLKEMVSRTVNPLIISGDEKGIDVEVTYDTNIHQKLIGDPGRLSQILNNLIFNAIKFTERGGVYIHFGTVETKENIVELRCSVRDTGIGIAKEDQPKLFDSFHQVDGSITRKHGGTGLGLAITKSLVDRMDGDIEVDSVLGRGSIFSFTVRLKPVTIQRSIKQDQIKIELPKLEETLNILLVEDDLINRKMTKKILQKQSHQVTIAKNGKEAVAAFDKDNFDIILMDIQMPEMDGIKASKIIKKRCRERGIYVPIIALTAYAIAGDEERFIGEGMDDYISKPIDLIKFFDVITRNIGRQEPEAPLPEDDIQDILKRVQSRKENVELGQNDLDDQEVFGRILKFFRIIEQGLREHDFEAIESAAHRLKNLLAEVGYVKERKVTFKLELAARKSDIEKVVGVYNDLKICFNFEGKE
jgi:PAS domain S-box-containing protein